MHTCFVHWLSVRHANDTLHLSLFACMSGCSFICEWALWSLFYSDCLYGQAMGYCFIPFCLIALCLLHMHYKSFYIQWSNCVVVFQEILVLMIQSFTDSSDRYEWVSRMDFLNQKKKKKHNIFTPFKGKMSNCCPRQ